MKKTKQLLAILFFLLSPNLSAQSLSASKINSFLNQQSSTVIKQELKNQSFKLINSNSEYNVQTSQYSKAGSYGSEEFAFGRNSELFMITYKPSVTFYRSLKEKMLTSNFVYTYSHGNNKYFESHNMRIGINDKAGIISFFVALK